MRWCPECGTGYEDAVAACPACRVVLVAEPPEPGEADAPVVIHRVPDPASGALLNGILLQAGFHAVLRTASLPAYGIVGRDWGTTHWGELLVPRGESADAKAAIADYLAALERGGLVRDEDVEGTPPGE